MPCEEKELRELLPDYIARSLPDADRSRVEQHLAACGDCMQEISLLCALAGEAVPDPGEAFWAAMPGQIARGMQQRDRSGTGNRHSDLLAGLLRPRSVWTAAALAGLAFIVWFLVQPRSAERTAAVGTAAVPAFEQASPTEELDLADQNAAGMADLTSADIARIDRWAAAELASLQVDPNDATADSSADESLSERIEDMSPRELKRFSSMLDEYRQEGST